MNKHFKRINLKAYNSNYKLIKKLTMEAKKGNLNVIKHI